MIKLVSILLSVSFVLFQQVHAEEWKTLKDADGIQVQSRPVADSAYHEFRGTTIVEAPIASALGVLDDTAACPEWLGYCELSTLLDDNGFGSRHVYQVNDLPFPASNRDVVTKVTVSHDVPSGEITISMESVPDYYPRQKYLRIIKSSGFFNLTPLSPSTTRVIWQHHADPGGKLPAFLANSMIVDLPFKSLQKMRLLVKEEKYQRLALTFDEAGNMTGLLNRSW